MTEISSNKNRKIERIGDEVLIWINNKLPSYTDCPDIMFPIMEMPIWSWHWRADGRLGAVASSAGKEAGIIADPYLYQLRWAAEYYGARGDIASIARALAAMRNDFRAGTLNIDHLDNNYRNCNLWNLSTMTREENASKCSLTAKIYEPFYWFSVNVHGNYRIICGEDISSPLRLLCASSAEYLSLLRSFYNDGLGVMRPPREINAGKRAGYQENGNLTDSGSELIDYLLATPDSEFAVWNAEEKEG